MVLSVPLSETKLTSDVACPTQSINQGLWVKALSLGFSTFFKFRDMVVLIAASPIIGRSWLSLPIGKGKYIFAKKNYFPAKQ